MLSIYKKKNIYILSQNFKIIINLVLARILNISANSKTRETRVTK